MAARDRSRSPARIDRAFAESLFKEAYGMCFNYGTTEFPKVNVKMNDWATDWMGTVEERRCDTVLLQAIEEAKEVMEMALKCEEINDEISDEDSEDEGFRRDSEQECKDIANKWLTNYKRFKRGQKEPEKTSFELDQTARAALGIVLGRDAQINADTRVQDLEAEIRQLKQELVAKDAEISDLRIGKGPIGPILAEYWKKISSPERLEKLRSQTESVIDWFGKVRLHEMRMNAYLSWREEPGY
jgi:hypothetical protein